MRLFLSLWDSGQGMTARREEALAAYRRGALEEALAIQERVVKTRDPKPEAEDFLALCLMMHSQKNFAKAVEVLREALQHYPDSAPLHENLGVLLLLMGETQSGVDALQRALALGSQSVNLL